MYLIASPFVSLFVFFKINPNQVTAASTGLAILASFALNTSFFVNWFYILWFLALILDFSDGMLARKTGNVRSNFLRFDHLSDIFKIAVILLGVCLHFNDVLIWILGFSTIFLYQFCEIVFHDMEHLLELKKSGLFNSNISKLKYIKSYKLSAPCEDMVVSRERIREKYSVIKCIISFWPQCPKYYDIFLTQFKSIFINFEGHTLLLFLILPVNKVSAVCILLYMSSLSIRHAMTAINVLHSTPRLDDKKMQKS